MARVLASQTDTHAHGPLRRACNHGSSAPTPCRTTRRFRPTAARAAGRRRGGSRKHCVIAASGSTLPKWWPYLNDLADALIVRGFQVWLLGDLRDLQLKARPGLHVVGTTWSIREAMTFALQSELVIG